MKRNWYLPFAVEALACTLLFWWQGPNAVFMNGPLIMLGRGLRQLSLTGGAGNFAAWVIYVGLCAAPLALLGVKLARGKGRLEDCLLILLSMVLAWGLYYLVNPSLFPTPGMGDQLAAQMILAVAVSWAVLSLLQGERPERLLRYLLNALAAVLVFGAWGLELGRLLEKIRAVRAANDVGDLFMTNLFLTLGYLVKLTACVLDLWMIRAGQNLLSALSRDAYSQETLDAAGALTRRCTLSLRVVVLASLGLNLLQILAAKHLRDLSLHVSIPLDAMALILSLLLLCRLLGRSKELKDDSDLII